MRKTTEERFWENIDLTDTCWLWTGTITKHGYGRFAHNYGAEFAHRWSYMRFVGPIPDGLQIDHLCRVRNCVRPEHLEAVTPQENTLRGEGITAQQARQTHCTNGHEFTVENIYLYRGHRHCLTCKREKRRDYSREREPVVCEDCGDTVQRGNLLKHRKRRHPERLRAALTPEGKDRADRVDAEDGGHALCRKEFTYRDHLLPYLCVLTNGHQGPHQAQFSDGKVYTSGIKDGDSDE